MDKTNGVKAFGREGPAAPAGQTGGAAADRFAEAVKRAQATGRGAPRDRDAAVPVRKEAPKGGEPDAGKLVPGRSGRGDDAAVSDPSRRAKDEDGIASPRAERKADDAQGALANPASVPPGSATVQSAAEASSGAARGGASVVALLAGEAAPLASSAGLAAADALMPKLAPRMPSSFVLTFPPNAWPLIRAEGSRGPNGLNLRLTAADAKDEAKLKSAIASLREALEGAGHAVGAITVLTDGE